MERYNSIPIPLFEEDAGQLKSARSLLERQLLQDLFMSPLASELPESEFFQVFANKTVAQTHLGAVSIVIPNSVMPFYFMTVQQFTLKSNSFKLDMDEFSKTRAAFPKFDPLDLSYYDTYDWYFTGFLNKLYLNQFGPSGLLMPDYRCLTFNIRQGQLLRTYTNCAISKPEPAPYTTSIGVLTFNFSIFYKNYTEHLLDDQEPETPTAI